MKRNGFTLIELLAVIVILAIIALIATPIVLNIINNAKTSSNERSGELYVKAVENAIMKKQMNGTFTVEDGEYTVQSDGSICIVSNNACREGTTITIDVEGDSPTEGTITVSNGVVVSYNLVVSGTSVTKGKNSDNEEDEAVEGSATFSGYYTEFDEDGYPIEESFVAEEKTLTWEQLIDGVDKDKYGYDNSYITTTKVYGYYPLSSGEEYSGAFLNCLTLKSIVLPSTIIEIGDLAFYESSLTGIMIPSSVTSIGAESFGACSSLTNITIPSSVESIGEAAFARSGLESITIPSSVTSIVNNVFCECENLTTVTIADNVTSIGTEVFAYSTSLITITYNGVDYTSKTALETALTNNSVTVDNSAFDGTGLSN